ncbi:biopolymer transporter ExbD [Ilyomonas limi]|uniref:Biopolymer transporter ExbD n=1 Tax=Ilyomonas limi TaxID=2575867 RepID=A0A4U3L4X7_9BACT|nr:biopolymer transporter ExbD [Ilyomonas limi]TKK68647.1 biopolymer transporter ExbD [Ilyomonas limi]
MARPKIARKSTSVDMTAMCDVAFLLLSFFILTAKPKPSTAVTVQTPSSVSSKKAPEENMIMVTITKDGKVFLNGGDNAEDKAKMESIINSLNQANNLGLTGGEIKKLVNQPIIGVPLANLKQQATLQPEQINEKSLPGIPVKDTANNELIKWMRGVVDVYTGGKVNLLLKGDNLAKYPYFKNVLTAFKKNDLLKFQMVTEPENVPEGTVLYKQGGEAE